MNGTAVFKDPCQIDLFDQPETVERVALYENLFGKIDEIIIEQFKKYHSENPHVFNEFRRMAFQIKSTGRKFYSSDAIIHALRYDFDIRTTGEPFKISNTLSAMYARFLVYKEPEFVDFFKFKKVFDRKVFVNVE